MHAHHFTVRYSLHVVGTLRLMLLYKSNQPAEVRDEWIEVNIDSLHRGKDDTWLDLNKVDSKAEATNCK